MNRTSLPPLTELSVQQGFVDSPGEGTECEQKKKKIIWHIYGKEAYLGTRYQAKKSTGGHETMAADL